MPPNEYRFVSDYNLGTLSVGTHTLTIRTDTAGVVAESNESDNEYTKTITISGTPDIRIDPLTVTFNVTNAGGGLAPGETPDASPSSNDQRLYLSAEQKLFLADEVSRRFDTGAERVDVIVNLASPPGKPREREWDSKARLAEWHGAVKSRQDEVLSTLAAEEFRVRHRY